MKFHRLLPVLACLALAAAGCGKSSPTEPTFTLTQADADDLAQQIAFTSVASDWGSYLLAGNTPSAPGAARAARARPARMFAAAQWDTAFTQGSVNFSFVFSFYDQALNVQADYNPLTTWQIEEDSQIDGTIAVAGDTSAFSHTGNIQFSGTRTSDDTLSFAGTAQDTAYSHFTSAFRGVERWAHLDLVRSINGVKTLKTAGSYPHAGTVTWIATLTLLRSASRADVEATVDADATLAFNGTRYAVLTLTSGWRYAVDLETGAIVRL